jgi:hypothetical protein
MESKSDKLDRSDILKLEKEISKDTIKLLETMSSEPIIIGCKTLISQAMNEGTIKLYKGGVVFNTQKNERLLQLEDDINKSWKKIIGPVVSRCMLVGICPVILTTNNDGEITPTVPDLDSYTITTYIHPIKKKQCFNMYWSEIDNTRNIPMSRSPYPLRWINQFYDDEEDDDNSYEDEENIDEELDLFGERINDIYKIKTSNKKKGKEKTKFGKQEKDVYFVLHNGYEPNKGGQLRSMMNSSNEQISFATTIKKTYILASKANANPPKYVETPPYDLENLSKLNGDISNMQQFTVNNKSQNSILEIKRIEVAKTEGFPIKLDKSNSNFYDKEERSGSKEIQRSEKTENEGLNNPYGSKYTPDVELWGLSPGGKLSSQQVPRLITDLPSLIDSTSAKICTVFGIPIQMIVQGHNYRTMSIDEISQKTFKSTVGSWTEIIENLLSDLLDFLKVSQYSDYKIANSFIRKSVNKYFGDEDEQDNIINPSQTLQTNDKQSLYDRIVLLQKQKQIMQEQQYLKNQQQQQQENLVDVESNNGIEQKLNKKRKREQNILDPKVLTKKFQRENEFKLVIEYKDSSTLEELEHGFQEGTLSEEEYNQKYNEKTGISVDINQKNKTDKALAKKGVNIKNIPRFKQDYLRTTIDLYKEGFVKRQGILKIISVITGISESDLEKTDPLIEQSQKLAGTVGSNIGKPSQPPKQTIEKKPKESLTKKPSQKPLGRENKKETQPEKKKKTTSNQEKKKSSRN